MKKDSVLDAINDFPQEFELEELIEKLVFVEKVEKGLHQLEEGKTTSHEEVKEAIKKW
jgi:predicted transcriptional regulator